MAYPEGLQHISAHMRIFFVAMPGEMCDIALHMEESMSQTAEQSKGAEAKKKRQGRSPAFPFIPLSKALERAETFRVAEGGRPKHFTPLTAACKAWGIGSQTGTAIQTVAALGHFGLFEFEGSGDKRAGRLTDLAFSILHDKQLASPERDQAVQCAALMPKIHSELWDKWQEALPSDPTIETFLVRDRGFSEAGAANLIAEYKATIAFAKLDQPDIIPEEKSTPKVGFPAMDEAFSGMFKRPPTAPPLEAEKVKIMEGERIAFTEEGQPGQYLKLVASGEVDDTMLEALEDFVKRQRKRIKASVPNQESDGQK